MGRSFRKANLRGFMVLASLVVSACARIAFDDALGETVDPSVPVDQALYAGEVVVGIPDAARAAEWDFAVPLWIGLSPETQTRLEANAFADLRIVQLALPELLSGSHEPSCSVGLDIDFHGAEAQAQNVVASATADVRLYRCRHRDTDAEIRGGRILTQPVRVAATLEADLEAGCVVFRVTNLEVAPTGIVGGLATLLGVTGRARTTILEQTSDILAENPICPVLPPVLSPLDLRFASAHFTEIAMGGIGASLTGSVDLSADTVVDLVAFAATRNSEWSAVDGDAGQITLQRVASVDIRGAPVDLGLRIGLHPLDATEIGIYAGFDLSEVQAQVSDVVAGEVLMDECGSRMVVQSLDLVEDEAQLDVLASVVVSRFECTRTAPTTWERGALQENHSLSLTGTFGLEFDGSCVLLRLPNGFETSRPMAQIEVGVDRVALAKALTRDTVRVLLEGRRFCTDVPPAVAALDPQLEMGRLQEVGDGGLAVEFAGSIDVRTANIIALLQQQQQ